MVSELLCRNGGAGISGDGTEVHREPKDRFIPPSCWGVFSVILINPVVLCKTERFYGGGIM